MSKEREKCLVRCCYVGRKAENLEQSASDSPSFAELDRLNKKNGQIRRASFSVCKLK
jgi:hypothetical protein